MPRKRTWGAMAWAVAGAVAMLSGGGAAYGQSAAPGRVTLEALAGSYEGTAIGPDGGSMVLRAELKVEAGRLTGFVDAQAAQVSVVGGTLQGDTLTLTIEAGGATGTMSGKVADRRIEGSWTLGEMAGSFTIVKLQLAPSAAPAGDPISGVWVGEANVQGQAMPFTLTMKLDGDRVTGDIESAMGKVPLAGGTWTDGTLSITFPYVGGEPVSMGAQIKDGKLEGILDYNTGELQGTWVASKK